MRSVGEGKTHEMGQNTGDHSGAFTDDDLEKWGAQAESAQGYTGDHIGPDHVGRPVSIGEEVRPFTFRVDAARRAKLVRVAAERAIMRRKTYADSSILSKGVFPGTPDR